MTKNTPTKQLLRSQSLTDLKNDADKPNSKVTETTTNAVSQPPTSTPALTPATTHALTPAAVQPLGKPTFAKKLMENAPKYLIQRILSNINAIHGLISDAISGRNLNVVQVKQLLTQEIHKLTENLNDPALQDSIKNLTDAADRPLTLFINKLMEIIKRHVNDVIYKTGSLVGNAVGEIPILNIPVNAALAVSNGIHVVKNFTDLGEDLFQNVSTFKTDMENVVQEFNPSLGHSIGEDYGVQPNSQSGAQQHGGYSSHINSNIKEAKKHLHHLHRKKNRTLKRINHSIRQFLSSNRKSRSIKAHATH